MIQRIVFFVSSPLYYRDYERFGAEKFINAGFKVIFFNFASFLNPLLYNKATQKNRYEGDKQKIFFKKEDAISEISKLTNDCFVISLIHYRHDTFRIYKTLSIARVPYALSLINTVPTSNLKWKEVDLLIKRILNIKLSRLSSIIKNKLFNPAWSKYLGIREPEFILAGGEKSLEHPQAGLTGEKTEVLWLHTLDYDIYLKNKETSPESKLGVDTAVFIDSPSPKFAHDALIPGIYSPLTEKIYYPSLCKFFDRLEKELSVRVVIASHPKSGHDRFPDYFGKRETVQGKTFELIRQSKFVINRNSTSLNFAIILNKPVIFHTSSEVETYPPLANQIRSMAHMLGKEPINIDHSLDINWEREILIDEGAFAQYKKLYIKKGGTEEIYSWQTVAGKLQGFIKFTE